MKGYPHKLRLQLLIGEINKFSSVIANKYPGIGAEKVSELEELINIKLPNDFKEFLTFFNGVSIMGFEIYGIGNIACDLASVYNFEHGSVAYPQPKFLVPISPDGRGNFYCLDTSKLDAESDQCPVVFWFSNFDYQATGQEPEIDELDFITFANKVLIEWTLEDYDYEGNSQAPARL